MAFEATVSGNGQSIILKNNLSGSFAEIFSFGALLNKFCTRKDGEYVNVIDGFKTPEEAPELISSSFKSAKLSPFVCRMRNGAYVFENKTYRVSKFYLGRHAIHGLLFNANFTIKNTTADDLSATVVLNFHYQEKDEGFPFPFEAEITYRLEANCKLTLITRITNTGQEKMPLSDGWHPYFKLGKQIDELFFEMNSDQMVAFDSDLLPTGSLTGYPLFFKNPAPLKNVSLDNCFLLRSFGEPACILTDRKLGLEISILPKKSYPYLQLFTPDHRKSIAIENLSSPPDAFNNKTGLIIVDPGSTEIFETSYEITQQANPYNS